MHIISCAKAENGPSRQTAVAVGQVRPLALIVEKRPVALLVEAAIRSRLLEVTVAGGPTVICRGLFSRPLRRLAKHRCRIAAVVTSCGSGPVKLAGLSTLTAAATLVSGLGQAQRCIRLVTRLVRGSPMVISGRAFVAAIVAALSTVVASLPVKAILASGPFMRRRFSRPGQGSRDATALVIAGGAAGVVFGNSRV